MEMRSVSARQWTCSSFCRGASGTISECSPASAWSFNRLDAWAKVKGLAKFADEHAVEFGRLMVGRKVGDILEVVDVADHQVREKARKMGAPADLDAGATLAQLEPAPPGCLQFQLQHIIIREGLPSFG
jgi:hypothetical protein